MGCGRDRTTTVCLVEGEIDTGAFRKRIFFPWHSGGVLSHQLHYKGDKISHHSHGTNAAQIPRDEPECILCGLTEGRAEDRHLCCFVCVCVGVRV